MKFSQVVESLAFGHRISRPSASDFVVYPFDNRLRCGHVHSRTWHYWQPTVADLRAADWEIGPIHGDFRDAS